MDQAMVPSCAAAPAKSERCALALHRGRGSGSLLGVRLSPLLHNLSHNQVSPKPGEISRSASARASSNWSRLPAAHMAAARRAGFYALAVSEK